MKHQELVRSGVPLIIRKASVIVMSFIVLAVALWIGQTSASAQTATPTATTVALAPCPSGVTITVSPPIGSAPTTVSVVVSPALNLKPATAGDPNSFHLHYFIDTPAAATGTVIPEGNPQIIHSAATTQNLGTLAPGSHTVTVVLGQLNHTACDARGSVTFTVAQSTTAASPVAPQTGNGGLLDQRTPAVIAVFMLCASALAVIGARRATARR